MKILYDNIGFNEIHGGVSRYFTQMICHLPKECEVRIAVKATCNAYLEQPPFNIPHSDHSYYTFMRQWRFRGKYWFYQYATKFFPGIVPSIERENEKFMIELVEQGDFDVLHLTGPHFVGDSWKCVVGKKPIVITIHDLIPEKYNLLRGIRESRQEILDVASQVITVSETTRNALRETYNISEKKITVVHHGVSLSQNIPTTVPVDEKGHILFVGKRDGYKNFCFFIQSIARFLHERRNLSVICVGAKFNCKEMKMLARLGIVNQVLVQQANDFEMRALYEGAICLIVPSLDEGFGLPILEAFACGCPVLLSNIRVFHEIAGGAAAYFNAESMSSIEERVRLLANDPMKRKCLIKAGYERVREYSWDKCAADTYSVYSKAVMC